MLRSTAACGAMSARHCQCSQSVNQQVTKSDSHATEHGLCLLSSSLVHKVLLLDNRIVRLAWTAWHLWINGSKWTRVAASAVHEAKAWHLYRLHVQLTALTAWMHMLHAQQSRLIMALDFRQKALLLKVLSPLKQASVGRLLPYCLRH